MAASSSPNGIVVVDKSGGMTSHDVVFMMRKLFQTKRAGHTGTLDPDATGVLVICLGQATRLAEYLSAARKHYVTEVVFGIETDTQDVSGRTLAEADASHLNAEMIGALLPGFRGRILQTPPMMSALHHQGQRLYELARAGVTVERAARPIIIDELELTAFASGTHPVATLEVTCSTGTYIRTLAADLGAAARAGGTMRSLRRTWVGDDACHAFTLNDAHTLDDLREQARDGTLTKSVLSPAAALKSWPQAQVDEAEAVRLRNGQRLDPAGLDPARQQNWQSVAEGCLAALLNERGEVVAVARLQSGWLHPVKVLAHESV